MLIRFEKPLLLNLVLAIFYTVGIVGLSLPQYRELFVALMPWHLLLTLVLLLVNHGKMDARFIAWSVFVMVSGFLVEWLGVKTGLIFGQYHYGNNLGVTLHGIPLIIGVNWLILAYCCHDFASRIFSPLLLKSLFAALLMTVFDYIMEPVATILNLWHWDNNIIPLQNFAGWFIFSLMLFLIANLAKIKIKNPSSVILFLMMLIFFLTLRVTLH